MRRYVFLDRDGTLIQDHGYTHRLADYVLLPGVPEALVRLVAAGYRLAIVTNQSGIGRGLFPESDFLKLQEHLVSDLGARGIPIERSYWCPHRPEEGCACRKPAPGMLERARDELAASLDESWVIGDSARDIGLAERAGCHGAILVLTGEGPAARDEIAPDTPVAADLAAAVDHILKS